MMSATPFKNYRDVATTPARVLALDIAAAGLAALAPDVLLQRALLYRREDRVLEIMGRPFSFSRGRLFVIGGGKAADVMAVALENLLGPDVITAGLVICKTQSAWPRKIEVREASHPIPDDRGLKAMAEMMAMREVHRIGENDLLLCLLSGGASALMPCPAPGVTLEDKRILTGLLLGCGAEIAEVNGIRKHLSRSKGGKLGRHFAPAQVVSLIVSDVIGNDMSAIASGPTVPEKTRPRDALEIIRRYGLWDRTPPAALRFLEDHCDDPPLETLPNCANYIIGDNALALKAMADKAAESGKRTFVLADALKGEPEAAAGEIAKDILQGAYHGYDVLLAGGETTPVLPVHSGRGGRNQHFAAATLSVLRKLSGGWTHVSLGSDGSDYLPETAGAIVDRSVLERADIPGLSIRNSLDRFDTNTFFRKIGGCLLETGPTGTNVGDLMVYVL